MTQNNTNSFETDLLVTYKPSGLRTHRSSPHHWGFVEWLEQRFQQKLYPFQRLDSGTSGIMLIAKTDLAARVWTEKLHSKLIHKTYLFITRTSQTKIQEGTVHSSIQKERGTWISKSDQPWNSETHFTLLATEGAYQLWQVNPKTGKAHQIRLHAQSLGLSILGDKEHGGAPFFRLCLHAFQLENPDSARGWQAVPPPYFQNLSLLGNEILCAFLDAHHQREQLQSQGFISSDTYRIAHQEFPQIRIDRFGEQNWVYDYHSAPAANQITEYYRHTQNVPTWIREMKNRGDQPNESLLQPMFNPKQHWQAKENDLTFELRADQGMSPGLFLDQRENRRWVKLNSQNKRVLNLFSYTCGFSVCAAAGEAKEVVSVDVSQRFLDWGKTNFSLNGLDPKKFEFWATDSLDFLKRTAKIERQFDLIICDPPSFGRSKRGVFKIDQDLVPLINLILPLMAQNAVLLISTNYEKWNQAQFENEIMKAITLSKYKLLPAPLPGLDFLETEMTTLKGILIKKQS